MWPSNSTELRLRVCCGLCCRLGLAYVGLVVEVEEHGEHENVLYEANERYQDWELAGIPHDYEQEVQSQEAKLQQLQLGDVTLPPEQVLHGAQRAGKVVGVHDRVHEQIDHAQHGAVRARQEGHIDVDAEDHAGMMIHVQEAHLRVLLAQHYEDLRKSREVTVLAKHS